MTAEVKIQTRNHRYVTRSHKCQLTKKDTVTVSSNKAIRQQYGPTPCSLRYLMKWPEFCRVYQVKCSRLAFQSIFYRLFLRWNLIWHALRRWCQTRQFFGFFTHHRLQSAESSTPLWNMVVPKNETFVTVLLYVACFVNWINIYLTVERQNNFTGR